MSGGREGLAIGDVVGGRYEVRFLTAEGPAYRDYRVHDREVEVELALWRMDAQLFAGPRQAEFASAAREMRGLVHAHLRRLFEVGLTDDGAVYLTSQLGSAEGIALRLGSGRAASELDILRYASAMAEGLEAVHAAGHLHGRMVPADVVEVAGIIKVSGAGLYGGLDPALAAERWGEAGRYVAPEVLATGQGDRRADVYSMAAILCELASGVSRPDLGEATEALAAEQLALADLLARALSRSPDRRPARPAELVERVRRLFVDERVPTMKRPVLIPPEAHRTVKSPALQRELDTRGPAPPDEASEGDSDGEGRTIEESSPLFLHPSAAPSSPLFGPNQPTLTDGRAPRGLPPPAPGQPQPPEAPPAPPLVIPLHSRRPADEPKAQPTPIIPAIDRPEMQPVMRPLSSLRQPAQGGLGHYAPPLVADRVPFPAPPSRRRLLLVIGLSAAAVLVVLAVVLAPWSDRGPGGPRAAPARSPIASGGGAAPPTAAATAATAATGPTKPARPAPSAAAASPPAAPGPCPEAMALVARDLLEGAHSPFCIDRNEWPAGGKPPRVGASLEEAASMCAGRGARLCKPGEWEDACRGPSRASFPYGGKYVDKVCNARGTEIAAAGSFPECQSAAGAFDMSGNAAEWDADGGVRGASAVDGTRGRCSEPRRSGKPRIRAEDRADIGFRCCASPEEH
ncbi:MAG TPA: SUMF1/EgtB/PvdO family nonheme iron enzyme [Kofleriaceae bacterium]|nr:SUMF1/EgtB/PvdO family nonheme iron enzyme [Kofleriaceae bacterium]